MTLQIPDEPDVRRAAFFDLEKTLTPHAVEQITALAFYRRGELRLRDIATVAWVYVRYDLGLIGQFEAMKRQGARVFAGRSAEHDIAAFARFYEEELAAAIHPEARDLAKAFRMAGVPIYIVSSTYGFMVEPYARELGAEAFFGASLEIVDGRCTGDLTGELYHQHTKAAVVRRLAEEHGYDLSRSWAFGDSPNDIAMLEAVGRPIAVNPSSKLRKAAAERGWAIVEWGSR